MIVELDRDTVESSELVEQTFHFWFNDREHIRSPFPTYIQQKLKQQATDRFYAWTSNLTDKAKEELDEPLVAQKFEEMIFETAYSLVMTEDEKITISYPFLPRLGDEIQDNAPGDLSGLPGKSTIVDRAIVKEGDTSFLQVKMQNTETGRTGETRFELPV